MLTSCAWLFFAGVLFGLGNLYTIFLKPGNTYYRSNHNTQEETSNKPEQFQKMKKQNRADMRKRSLIKDDIKQKPWILAGYVFAFMNGTGLAITSQLLNLYVQSFNLPNGRSLGS